MTRDRSTVLVVADTHRTQDLLLEYLKGSGFRVLLATDGETALDVSRHSQPDIILLDVILPGIDGFETCRRLKSNRHTRAIPVIFITAQTSTVDKLHGFALGAVDYIEKPIQSEEVLARLKTHLTIQRLQKDLATQNLRLQNEINERERLIEELDAFAHTVAHDLKNPLGSLLGHAQFLRGYHTRISPGDFENTLDTIVKSGARMNNIIEELLLLSSVRSEDIVPKPLDMGPILDEVFDRLAFLITEFEVHIESPDTTTWPWVLGHGPWIEEVWINYISNGIKYGGSPPHIELGATPHRNGLVEFWVKDNGLGLTEADQVQLFIPFNRLNQVRAEGHGLGLSIVRRIVNKLGGQVGVRSHNGRGSTFSFYLRPAAAGEPWPPPSGHP